MRPSRHGDTLAIVVVISGLYWFVTAFFLAKRSLASVSSCGEARQLLHDVLGLSDSELKQLSLLVPMESTTNGCWLPRTVDSLIILVVDALRFDFAYYNLPKSIGNRIHASKTQSTLRNQTMRTRLYQFVADPPTVTMQRLKALTTGGLPTFADISANLGGASIEEDSWVYQISTVDPIQRGTRSRHMGFVGDDTWNDLFPWQFSESYPYPSFNTRDLDTVDNGCFAQMPHLLKRIRTRADTPDALEVVVVHFLGVDHVGHTYGPHNEHMDAKLRTMDDALAGVLDQLDNSDACHVTFIFGDHGMTADGNHGGGTIEETHAALFAHHSKGCHDAHITEESSSWQLLLEGPALKNDLVQEAAFAEIHQIDLVPTITFSLGLPVPYANMGSYVPSLLPDQNIQYTLAALALNAAQVWRYLSVYSSTANHLPDLPALEVKLKAATLAYKEVLAAENLDSDTQQRAASMYKIFLQQALELGQRVWTRFDTIGMIVGITMLAVGLVGYSLLSGRRTLPLRSHSWEVVAAVLFMVYQCGLLTFSNSYIYEEQHSIMFSLSILSGVVAFRLWSDPRPSTKWKAIIAIPILARAHELLVSGHGLDPSIRLHAAHHSLVFVSGMLFLGMFRWYLYRDRFTVSLSDATIDCIALLCLTASWWEKRDLNPDRNGFLWSRLVFFFLTVGMPVAIFRALLRDERNERPKQGSFKSHFESDVLTVASKSVIAIMTVTGPAAAASVVLYTAQIAALYYAVLGSNSTTIHPIVLSAILKLVTRHMFFATNHGCAFNRLHLSAAFIATKEFYFALGGVSLFLNTFGWEMVGLLLVWLFSYRPKGSKSIWRVYAIYQIAEALFSCISVSVLRRHLMVWDLYAPHFLFKAIFTVLNLLVQLTAIALANNGHN